MHYAECTQAQVPHGHPVAVFARFWQRVRGDRIAPDWSSFDPTEHPKILPWVLLLKPEADGQLRYTVCGTGCTETFGFSYQGKLFGEALPPAAVKLRAAEFRRAAAGEAPLFSQTALPIPGREYVDVFRGVFPFLAEDGALQRLVVIIAPTRTKVRDGDAS